MLKSPDDDPVLAAWQYGLGRAVAWTPSVDSPWAESWPNWPDYGKFWAQIIRYTLPEPDSGSLQARILPHADPATRLTQSQSRPTRLRRAARRSTWPTPPRQSRCLMAARGASRCGRPRPATTPPMSRCRPMAHMRSRSSSAKTICCASRAPATSNRPRPNICRYEGGAALLAQISAADRRAGVIRSAAVTSPALPEPAMRARCGPGCCWWLRCCGRWRSPCGAAGCAGAGSQHSPKPFFDRRSSTTPFFWRRFGRPGYPLGAPPRSFFFWWWLPTKSATTTRK